MRGVMALAGVGLILLVLSEAFETILLPRRVTRPFRVTRLYYQSTWAPWAFVAGRIRSHHRRGTFLSLYGPLSLLVLFGLWAVALIAGFALIHWSLELPLDGAPGGEGSTFWYYAYFSGVTFFTLGYGDATPSGPPGRLLAVVETGLGFGFLAVVIGYLPVLYQAFSRREVTISLFDARAGSPPTAATLLVRSARQGDNALLAQFLSEWERWAAEVLESHISFPVLSFYRSQHDNQSWLAALTAVLDASALVVAGGAKGVRGQAYLTFAMARHVVVDLCQALQTPPVQPPEDRLDPGRLAALRGQFAAAGVEFAPGSAVDQRVNELRAMYEPFVHALAQRYLLPLPPVVSQTEPVDNWQTSAWMRRTRGFEHLTAPMPGDDHED